MKSWISFLFSAVLAAFVFGSDAEASVPGKAKPAPAVYVQIDISSQTMTVNVNGWPYGRWKVSTARAGYHTPRGSWRPTRLAKIWFSKKYDNSPMPNSVFFYGGFAIHGTYYVKYLGRPASHGCVRLAPQNALALFSLVQKYGMSATRISIVD